MSELYDANLARQQALRADLMDRCYAYSAYSQMHVEEIISVLEDVIELIQEGKKMQQYDDLQRRLVGKRASLQ